MKVLHVYTIHEMLATPAIRYNHTALAKVLHISRGSVYKYANDTTNKYHSVLLMDGKYIFMHINTPRSNRRT